MTKKFDAYIKEMTEASVLGNDGAYNTGGDARIPKILMPIQKRRRHRKRRK